MNLSLVLLAIPIVLAITFGWRLFQRSREARNAVLLARDDPEMLAATNRAKASLPDFWAHFVAPAPGETDFMLRVSVSDGDVTEHLWCDQVQGSAESASAVVGSLPLDVHNVRRDQRIPVASDQISDWAYRRDGQVVGGKTLRVMQGRLPPKHPGRNEVFAD